MLSSSYLSLNQLHIICSLPCIGKELQCPTKKCASTINLNCWGIANVLATLSTDLMPSTTRFGIFKIVGIFTFDFFLARATTDKFLAFRSKFNSIFCWHDVSVKECGSREQLNKRDGEEEEVKTVFGTPKK